ncbi:LOW QUALITY PROTEIN: ubiquitin-protein ligase E3A [Drosophila tropicalis]|uniref:LOW QUALITY PROTEIN: ubiquitin-protein ligase E3A n=1 Tax=Drosophila tropicalis TaxID=46794 RepID=UPI0035AC0FFA
MSGGGDDQEQKAPSSASASSSAFVAENVAEQRATPEMKRSAVRSLIHRYFHQLQSGCGNAQCTNANCASSGKVAPMTPNEVAARALQLFSQDAQLCDISTQSTATSSSSSSSEPTNSPQQQDVDMLSPNDSSSSNSSSSSKSTTSSHSSTTTITSASSNSIQSQRALPLLTDTSTTAGVLEAAVSAAQPSSSSSSETPTLAPVESLDAHVLETLYKKGFDADNYDRIHQAISDTFSSIERLSKSFNKPIEEQQQEPPPIPEESTTSASKELQKLLAKSPVALNKEQLRTLEREHDKDEDSTQQQEEQVHEQEQEQELEQTEIHTETTTEELQRNEDILDEDEPMLKQDDETSTEGEEDTEEGEQKPKPKPSETAISGDTQLDFEGLRRVQRLIFSAPCRSLAEQLTISVIKLADCMRYMRHYGPDWEQVLHCLVICFDMATNTKNSVTDMEYLDRALPKLCHAAAVLPVRSQARLARIWATHCADQLKALVAACQQQITLQVLLDEEAVRENEHIISVTKVLKIVFYANILASELEIPSCRLPLDHDELESALGQEQSAAGVSSSTSTSAVAAVEDDFFIYSSHLNPHMPKFAEDQLEKTLQVSCIDCRNPLVPLVEFYNDALSDGIQMHHDYVSYKTLAMESELGTTNSNYFSFMLYAFILTPATKVDALYYDSRMRMYSERYSSLYSIFHNLNHDGDQDVAPPRPDLKLNVRRDQLINDALVGLELVAMSNPKDLKKQLVVEFVGEQGIDEGGVSKEFFQLIVEEIFNPAFGMFVQQEETNNMWFNATPFENGAQFTLIGIIIGLAIYNNVILAVNFPMVVYRKLMGYRGTFYDLSDWSPTLYKSLKSMLDYQGQDMEEVFDQTFRISYSNVFGEMVEHDLVPNGKELAVGQHNKKLFVNLYADFLLNTNIKQQFNSFRKGFEMVTDESPLKLLFRPEEIEMLVCGSREFDFVELEHSTEYEGGYTKETQIIQDFWAIVHGMPNESKRKLLEFTTGSARVPVGGLKCLRLLITRHGPDSDRLPTSHTCFNVLLLPEYSSKEKLEERLLKAINYSKGFGML